SDLPGGTPLYPPATLGFHKTRPSLPAKIDWSLQNPGSINKTRSEYTLDGIWRFQPLPFLSTDFDPNHWLYLRLPVSWIPFSNTIIYDSALLPIKDFNFTKWAAGLNIQIPLEQDVSEEPDHSKELLKDIPLWDGKPISQNSLSLLERDFYIQENMKGKLLLLSFPEVNPEAAVYLNDTLIGKLNGPNNEPLNVTDEVKYGETNRLSLLIGSPHKPATHATISKAPVLEVRKTALFELGIPLIVPSWQNKSLKVLLPAINHSDDGTELSIIGKIYNYSSMSLVKTTQPLQVALQAQIGCTELEFEFDATGLSEWTPENPQLYSLVLEANLGGKLLDITTPQTFGIAEVWMTGSELFLNGRHHFIRGVSLSGLSNLTQEMAKMLKRRGFNSISVSYLDGTIREENGIAIADQFGLTLSIPLNEVFQNTEKSLYKHKNLNHPSVIERQIGKHGWQNAPHSHPLQIGEVIDESRRATNRFYLAAQAFKEKDPFLLPTTYSDSGLGGDITGLSMSFSYGIPIQEMEDWLSDWALERPAGLILRNLQFYSHPAFLFQLGTQESVILEHYARFFGDSAYLNVSEALINSWRNIKTSYWLTPDYWVDFYSLAYIRAIRAWRTDRLTGYYLLLPEEKEYQELVKLKKWDTIFDAFNSPYLCYIAGTASNFTGKAHNYFSEESVNKSAVLVNDSFQELSGNFSWDVKMPDGSVLASSKATLTIPQGKRIFRPIVFRCPETKERINLKISINFNVPDEDLNLGDTFKLSVFPAPR
ncbi:MAG: hypothetical protein GX811_11125, partial [Lentisphaerae bacterium]|nr:hypothetical protein [Lentisphaerota bacterium]